MIATTRPISGAKVTSMRALSLALIALLAASMAIAACAELPPTLSIKAVLGSDGLLTITLRWNLTSTEPFEVRLPPSFVSKILSASASGASASLEDSVLRVKPTSLTPVVNLTLCSPFEAEGRSVKVLLDVPPAHSIGLRAVCFRLVLPKEVKPRDVEVHAPQNASVVYEANRTFVTLTLRDLPPGEHLLLNATVRTTTSGWLVVEELKRTVHVKPGALRFEDHLIIRNLSGESLSTFRYRIPLNATLVTIRGSAGDYFRGTFRPGGYSEIKLGGFKEISIRLRFAPEFNETISLTIIYDLPIHEEHCEVPLVWRVDWPILRASMSVLDAEGHLLASLSAYGLVPGAEPPKASFTARAPLGARLRPLAGIIIVVILLAGISFVAPRIPLGRAAAPVRGDLLRLAELLDEYLALKEEERKLHIDYLEGKLRAAAYRERARRLEEEERRARAEIERLCRELSKRIPRLEKLPGLLSSIDTITRSLVDIERRYRLRALPRGRYVRLMSHQEEELRKVRAQIDALIMELREKAEAS